MTNFEKKLVMDERYMKGVDKYEYEILLACQFPEFDYDDDGECLEYPHHTCFKNDTEAKRVISKTGLSEQSFYEQDSIVPVIEAYGLDKEKFWYAVVYVAFLTNRWSELIQLQTRLPTVYDQLKQLRDELVRCSPDKCPKKLSTDEMKECPDFFNNCIRAKTCHEFKVVFESNTESHSVRMAGNNLMRLFYRAINELMEKEEPHDSHVVQENPAWRLGDGARQTEKTWFAASLFMILLNKLNLQLHRSRKTTMSYDKKLLIAELIHFLGFTDNENLDGNSIKSILKSDRKITLSGL